MKTCFSDQIIGHKSLRSQFSILCVNNRFPSAILISGPQRVGKRLLALEAAALLSGMDNAVDIQRGYFPDLHFLEPRSGKRKIIVEDIRKVQKMLSLASWSGGPVFVIIDNAHSLTDQAANSLLKSLEESPLRTHFFLISHSPHLLPETITSRCHSFCVGNLTEYERTKAMEYICNACDADLFYELCSDLLPDVQECRNSNAIHSFKVKELKDSLRLQLEARRKAGKIIDDLMEIKKTPKAALASQAAACPLVMENCFYILKNKLQEKTFSKEKQISNLAETLVTLEDCRANLFLTNASASLQLTQLFFNLSFA